MPADIQPEDRSWFLSLLDGYSLSEFLAALAMVCREEADDADEDRALWLKRQALLREASEVAALEKV